MVVPRSIGRTPLRAALEDFVVSSRRETPDYGEVILHGLFRHQLFSWSPHFAGENVRAHKLLLIARPEGRHAFRDPL
jgi:hypothetical protein